MKEKPAKVLTLEASREGNALKIGAHERLKGQPSTIRHYEQIQISPESIDARCVELVDTLNRANRRGRVTSQVLTALREIGQVLYDELLPSDIKDKINKSNAEFLRLYLDDHLVQVPWELLYDGQQFLCQRFNMGRLVKTSQPLTDIKSRSLTSPLTLLILADPGGDLKGAYAEGTQLRDYLDQKKDIINVTLRSGQITCDSIKRKVRNFDILHFAGHADYDVKNPEESGWRLGDGSLKSVDITRMAGTAAMPALVFSNACQSARTGEWALAENFEDEIFGLANAFLLAGVNHYVGTFWEILDEPSRRFSLEFYKHAFSGMSVGEAMRQARLALIDQYGEETIVWASYLLYGDPSFNLTDHIGAQKPGIGSEPIHVLDSEANVRAHEEVVDFGVKGKAKKGLPWRAVAGVILTFLVLIGVYLMFPDKGSGEYEQEALSSYQTGNYPGALETCKVLQERYPGRSLAYVILGNIHFQEGDLEKARQDFQKALNAENGSNKEKADALIGLGRIASVKNREDEALKFYQEASTLAPDKSQAYVSRGILLDKQGKHEEALKLFGKALALFPDDRTIEAISNETREKITFSQNREKQERVDNLVRELLDNFDNSIPAVPSDGWTSVPLTLWMMDFQSQGYGMQEGEERLVVSGITDRLIEKSRVRIVERSILDKLLDELKLGASKLADPTTATSLGRIMAARVILFGRIVHSSPRTQVAIRLIETETGQVTAAVSETFKSSEPPSVIAAKLSEILLTKLNALYPLRGKINEINKHEINLNIGKNQGVRIGQQFKVVDTDLVLETRTVTKSSSTAIVMKGHDNKEVGYPVEAM